MTNVEFHFGGAAMRRTAALCAMAMLAAGGWCAGLRSAEEARAAMHVEKLPGRNVFESAGAVTVLEARAVEDGELWIELRVLPLEGSTATIDADSFVLARGDEKLVPLATFGPEWVARRDREGEPQVLWTMGVWRHGEDAERPQMFELSAKGTNVDVSRKFMGAAGLNYRMPDERGEVRTEVRGADRRWGNEDTPEGKVESSRRALLAQAVGAGGNPPASMWVGRGTVAHAEPMAISPKRLGAVLVVSEVEGTMVVPSVDSVTLERNGRSLGSGRVGKRVELAAGKGYWGDAWAVRVDWDLEVPLAVDDVFVLAAKGNDVDVLYEFRRAELLGERTARMARWVANGLLADGRQEVAAEKSSPKKRETGGDADRRREASNAAKADTSPARLAARAVLELEMYDPADVFENEHAVVVTDLMNVYDGKELWTIVSAIEMPGATVALAGKDVSLTRNGVALVADGGESDAERHVLVEDEPAATMHEAKWRLDPPMRAEDAFVLTAKGTNVDVVRRFTGAEIVERDMKLKAEAEARRAEAEKEREEFHAGPMGELRALLEVDRYEPGEVFEGEKSLAVVGITAWDGREASLWLSALAVPGESVSLLGEGMSLERNGVRVEPDEPLRHARMEQVGRREVETLGASPDWALDPPARPDDKFVFRAKGENIDIEFAFTGADVIDPKRVAETEEYERKWKAEVAIHEARLDAAIAAAAKVKPRDDDDAEGPAAEAVVKCTVIGGQFYVPVAIAVDGKSKQMVLPLDGKAERTAVAESALPAGAKAGKMTLEIGGIAHEVDVAVAKTGVLAPDAFGGMHHVLDEKAGTISLFADKAAAQPLTAEQKQAARVAKKEAERAKALAKLEEGGVAPGNISQSDDAIAWASLEGSGPRSLLVRAMLLELPHSSASIDEGSVAVTRNGVLLEGGERLRTVPAPREKMSDPHFVQHAMQWEDLGDMVRADDVFVATAAASGGLKVESTFKGSDIATCVKAPRTADAGSVAKELVLPPKATPRYVEIDGREIVCLWMHYQGDDERESRMRHLMGGRWDCFLLPPKDGECPPGGATAESPGADEIAEMESILDEIDAFADVFDEAMEGNRALAAAEKTAKTVRIRRAKESRLDPADWDFMADMANDAWYNEQSLAFIRRNMDACRAKVAELKGAGKRESDPGMERAKEAGRAEALETARRAGFTPERIFESDSAVTSVLVDGSGRFQIGAWFYVASLPHATARLEEDGVELLRNGKKVRGGSEMDSGLERPRLGVGNVRTEPLYVYWMLDDDPMMPDDEFVLKAKGRGVDVTYAFDVGDIIEQGRSAMHTVVKGQVEFAKTQAEMQAKQRAPVPEGMVAIPCTWIKERFVAVVGVEVEGKRVGEALLAVGGIGKDAGTALVPNSALQEMFDLSKFERAMTSMAEAGPIGVMAYRGKMTLVAGPRKKEVDVQIFEDGFVRRGIGLVPEIVLGEGYVVDEENMRILVKAK